MAEIVVADERIVIKENDTIERTMISAGKHPDAFLYLLNGRPIPMTTVPENDSIIEAVRVASGG
jgi:sulfur carrier protein